MSAEIVVEVDPVAVDVAVDQVEVVVVTSGPPGPPGSGGGGSAVIVQPEPPATDLPEGTQWVDSDSDVPPFDGPITHVRETASVTTAILAADATETGTIALAPGYRLYAITTSSECRVRLYTTAAKMAADAARPIGTDPTGDHGCVLEFVSTPALLSADLSPVVDGFDGKATPDGEIPITVTNLGGSSVAVTTDLTWIRCE
jgi:hypothetical protein